MNLKKAEDRYKKIHFLGEGQYAMVYKADDLWENRIVAVKKIKMTMYDDYTEGVNQSAIREIKILKTLEHDNIIRLLDVFGNELNISLVYDYMETDLLKIIENRSSILSPANIKSYLLMAFRGLEFLHNHFVLHRDLKPSNLLIDNRGVLKIGDFGLSKSFGLQLPMTSLVVTRWYRSPELIFGARYYGTGVDIWSMGCVFGELLKREPLFPGNCDLDQLTRIFTIRGSPSLIDWPGMDELPNYVPFNTLPKMNLIDIFTAVTKDILNLLENLLAINPLRRPTASEALKHEYFSNEPFPTAPHLLITPLISVDKSQKRAYTTLDSCRKKIKFT